MSAEKVTAKRLAEKGLGLLSRILTDFEDMAGNQLRGHAKNITDCVLACTKVQAEEREQLDFEKATQLDPEAIRDAMLDWLKNLPASEKQALMAEAGLIPPTMAPPAPEAQPHA